MSLILAIESSCDETSVAILKDRKVLCNIIANQDVHENYGGVVPELASREHQKNIVPVIDQALSKAKIKKESIDAIAFTRGPGLMGSLLVGVSFAKSFAQALDIPLIEVNHMQAHILAHFIEKIKNQDYPTFPFLALTVSGGHTQIVRVDDYLEMTILGSTLDDAAGEAFDKSGQLLGLNYPAGPKIDHLAKTGNPLKFDFPYPKVQGLNFSYSGLKTSILYFLQKEVKRDADFIKNNLNDLCASIQHAIVRILIGKLKRASDETRIKCIAIGGGVSANSYLGKKLTEMAVKKRWEVFIPPLEYTTDNAAMIGITGYYKYLKKDFVGLDIKPNPRMKVNE
jgi:N6-L-threonylcarbamoyladenine synthase